MLISLGPRVDMGSVMGGGRNYTEQEARNATVEGTKIARRTFIATMVSLPIGYLGIAATGDLWPFTSEEQSLTNLTVGRLAEELGSPSSATRRAAVTALSQRLDFDDPDRPAAITALAALLNSTDHIALREGVPADKAPPELNAAFEALGRANVTSEQMDLRGADLRGLEVTRVEFAGGLTLYGADLRDAVITYGDIKGGNMGDAIFDGAWFGGCTIEGWNLIGAGLRFVNAPKTLFINCNFANADVSGANFSTTTFRDCDFDGRNLADFAKDYRVLWDEGKQPSWPPGFSLQ
jgi:uncharacterized protein YjbI with pentapeptide repeats